MGKPPSVLSKQVQLCLHIAILLCAVGVGRAQPAPPPIPPLPRDLGDQPSAPPKIVDRFPQEPSQPPAFAIPLGSLGFSAPGVFYLLRSHSLVSLDFLDENRLLFTFQVAGLVSRDTGDEAGAKERKIRAVLVALPDGRIEAQAQWMVPDQARYLWMLKDGHFFLRDADGLEQGDATLKTMPFLRLPGRLLFLEMDPAQQVLITNSLESATAQPLAPAAGSPVAAPVADTTLPRDKPGAPQPAAQYTLVIRTLNRATGKVMQTTSVPFAGQTADWPINAEGYVESVKSSGLDWLLNLNYFAGGRKLVGRVDSICAPISAYASAAELVVNTCDPGGGGKLLAFSANGDQRWQVITSTNTMWPRLVMAPDGSRLARETLVLKRPAKRYKRLLSASDLQGQMVRVFDAADGKMRLEAPLSPMLDAGGNVAISPSGRRVAILNAGAIQVFELDAPSAVPGTATAHPGP
jgi:hypothetical protein